MTSDDEGHKFKSYPFPENHPMSNHKAGFLGQYRGSRAGVMSPSAGMIPSSTNRSHRRNEFLSMGLGVCPVLPVASSRLVFSLDAGSYIPGILRKIPGPCVFVGDNPAHVPIQSSQVSYVTPRGIKNLSVSGTEELFLRLEARGPPLVKESY